MWKVAMKIEGTFQCSSHVALSGLPLLDPIRLPNDDELVFSNPQKKYATFFTIPLDRAIPDKKALESPLANAGRLYRSIKSSVSARDMICSTAESTIF